MDKALTESGLKAMLSKNKIKDNGLEKALAAYEKLGDDEHDECLDQLAQIGKLATALKKAKEVTGNKAVADYLDDLLDAKGDEEKDVSKDKAAAAKTDAANQKKADKEKADKDDDDDDDDKDKDGDEEEEEEEGEYGDRLLTAFKKCKSMNGDPMDFVLCDAQPFPAIMLARRITSKHRKELTEMTDGSKKFHRGTCRFEDGKYVITTEQEMPGLVRRIQLSVKNHTGKKFKFMHGDETAGDEEGDAPDPAQPESTGQTGQAPGGGQQAGHVSGSQPVGAPPSNSGPAAPPPHEKPELEQAPAAWHKTRDIVKTSIEDLKKAVQAVYASEHPDLVKEIDKGLEKFDGILQNLDTRLADSLTKAHAANGDAARKAELQNCKGILTNYIKYVKAEPLIAQIDSNPFGVQTNVSKVLTESLTQMARAIS